MAEDAILSVQNLSIDYQAERGAVHGVRGVSFDLRRGEALALIGESGCGKTTLSLGLLRLLPSNSLILEDSQIIFRGETRTVDVLRLNQNELRHFRWANCAMVFQAAQNAFNPVIRISDQVNDTARAHGIMDKKAVRERILHLFELVRLEPRRVFNAYAHELSGGMRQRVLIALSLLLDPEIIILDEPTTALDILTQRTIIDVLKDLRETLSFSMIFISHDLSIAAELADRVATMYAGKLVEVGPVDEMFYRSRHPYTDGLIKAVPTMLGAHRDLISIPGSPPDLIDLPPGCKFHLRCPYATDVCEEVEPGLELQTAGHYAACYHIDELLKSRESTPDARSVS